MMVLRLQLWRQELHKKWHRWVVGHEGVRGRNGWENFGTGFFCKCGVMIWVLDKEVEYHEWLESRTEVNECSNISI